MSQRQSILQLTAALALALPPEYADRLMTMGSRLMPALAEATVHAVWSANRPLLNHDGDQDPMRISRGFACVDHQERDGVEGLDSLVGGKATTIRAMAEQAADLICRKTGRKIACATATTPLLPYRHIMQTTDEWI